MSSGSSTAADVIRSLAFYLVFYGGTILYVLAFWPAALLGEGPARRVVHAWALFHRRCARWLLGIRVVVEGEMPNEGVLVAVTIKQAQSFTWVMQLAVFPMFFLSGALYPVAGLPAWLEALNRVNPLTYAVDPMRHLVFDHLEVSETARRTLDPGVTWLGWPVPPLLEAGIVVLMGLALMGAAIRRFSRTETA